MADRSPRPSGITESLQRAMSNADRRDTILLAVGRIARELLQPGFPDEVKNALAEAGLSAGRLQVEITESTFVDRPEMASLVLGQIRALGAHVVLDDFGTGYSSLGYLLRYPVDALKIDRSFVGGLPDGKNAAKIAGSVLALAGALGLEVTAEGVESASQDEWLRERGCNLVQGYYFSPPLPAEAFQALGALT